MITPAKRTVLIGHRGTGKTSLLGRIEASYSRANRAVLCFDLDREIEKRTSRSVQEIFQQDGEVKFRQFERDVFSEINSRSQLAPGTDIYLACGAGFDPRLIPESWHVLWIRRSSDQAGRIFLNRPRLNPKVSALEEFRERFDFREQAYAERADEVLWLDEGLNNGHLDLAEEKYWTGLISGLRGALTLLPENFRSSHSFEIWASERVKWGIRWFELRDDLLNEEQMILASTVIPKDRLLVSFRSPKREASTYQLIEALRVNAPVAFDWPIERGACSYPQPRFLSLHERRDGESLGACLSRFPAQLPQGVQLKAALPVLSFAELEAAHEWAQGDPEKRLLLPLSPDGRWSWYRLYQGLSLPDGSERLNFFREGEGTGRDQPTLLQWLRRVQNERTQNQTAPFRTSQPQAMMLSTQFAAVLGDPVAHSRTPIEQGEFFAAFGAPVFAIRVTEVEWQQGALLFLQKLGLRWAAVTAPLKEQAYRDCIRRDSVAESLSAVNTLMWKEQLGGWVGINTDLEGLLSAANQIREDHDLGVVAVWGGGGTLQAIQGVFPEAELFSARTSENRNPGGCSAESVEPDTVIWALGRSRLGSVQMPPSNWKPRFVIDLNYSDDSPGKEFAAKLGCQYFSGLQMFVYQAEAQRRFWKGSVS
jgi:shikimate 5-dehydrogenase/shikimate kinase